ncbi:MAG: hypothetical protein RLZZ519_2118 [Bacteroidota bacterium]|jgi:hypothetical protein
MKFRIISLLIAVQMLFRLRLFAQVDGSKTYFLQAKHSGLVWDVANNSNDLYAVINQSPLHKGPSQQWKFVDAGNGEYFIQSQNAGKLFASIELGKGSPGTRMCTEMQWVGDYNKLRLVPAGDGYYKIIVKHTGMCMQVPSAEMGPTTLTQYPCQEGANHHLWKLVPTVEAPVKAQFDLSVPYKIQGKESGMWWEVINNSHDIYAPIGQAAHKDVANQLWKFVDAGDGYYFIQSQNPAGLFASIELGNMAAGARLVTEMQWVGDYTKFKIIPYGNPFDGTYKIIAKHSGMCVQVPGGGYGTGVLTQYPYQEGANHHLWWIFPSKPVTQPAKIKLVGTDIELGSGPLKSELAAHGLTLVQTGTLKPNQCAVFNPKVSTDGSAVSAEFGCLVCATKINDNVTLNTAAIYGGCNASASNGAGGACEVGVASSDLYVDAGGATTHFSVKGPSASACGSVSADKCCANVGASYASTSISIRDDAGNGIGIGVDAGVGAGISGSYEDGVVSFGVNLKFLAGGSITFSVNPADLGTKAIKGGSAAYIYTKGKLVAAGDKAKQTFTNLGSDIKSGTTVAAVKIGAGAENAWATVTNEVSGWGNTVGAFFSNATNGAKLNRALAPGEAYLSVFNQSGYVVNHAR